MMIRDLKLKLIFLLMLGLFCSYAGNVEAQVQDTLKISESYQDVLLMDILEDFQSKYNLQFAFDGDLLKDIKISVTLDEASVVEAMNTILSDTDLGFMLLDDVQILIRPKDEIEELSEVSYDINITGTLKDAQSGEPLPYATIYVKDTRKGTVTNQFGFFTLLEVPTDTSTIVCQYIGYQPMEYKLSSYVSKQRLDLRMERGAKELQEVVVWDDNIPQLLDASSDAGSYSVDPSTFKVLPSLGQVDVFRSLQLMPGIGSTNETSGGLVIRGSGNDKNLMLFDGISIYHLDHFFGTFSAFNADAIKNIQVNKGGFGAEYGGRVSGVVNITGKEGSSSKMGGTMGVNLLSASGYLEVPLVKNRLRLMLAGRRSYTDLVRNRLFQKLFDAAVETNASIDRVGFGGEPFIPTFFFYDVNAKLTWTPKDKDVFSLSYYGGRDELIFDERQQDSEDGFLVTYNLDQLQNWGTKGGSFRWGRQWSDRYASDFKISYSLYRSKLDDRHLFTLKSDATGEEGVIFNFFQVQNNKVQDASVKWDHDYALNSKHRLSYGVQATYNDARLTFDLVSTTLDEFDEEGTQVGVYVQDIYNPIPDWSITAGLRYNYFDLSRSKILEPRLSTSYSFNPSLRVKAAWGQYSQFVSRVVRHTVYSGSPDFWVLANGNEVPDITATHYIAGVTYEQDAWLLDGEVYFKKSEGIVSYIPRVVNFSPTVVISEDDFYFPGDERVIGLDVLLQKKVGKYTGWISYTLAKVTNKFDKVNQGEWFPGQDDHRHEFKTVNIYNLKRWVFALTWAYGSGKPFTLPDNTLTIENPNGDELLFNYADIYNDNRLPAYHRLDISVTYRTHIKDKLELELGASCFNLYNRKNIKYKKLVSVPQEITEQTGRTFVLTDVQQLGILPGVSMKISF
ncbi:TonB-dependent receptor [Limibacter armeniacum]|uniref:TonB-dependent receptor n=1 Tax=Limibacter armeniacum TaxID=466084 RepID=UPI002FE572BF